MSSKDMRLLAASGEAAGSVESEPVAMGLGCPQLLGVCSSGDNCVISWLTFGVVWVPSALGSQFAGSAQHL